MTRNNKLKKADSYSGNESDNISFINPNNHMICPSFKAILMITDHEILLAEISLAYDLKTRILLGIEVCTGY